MNTNTPNTTVARDSAEAPVARWGATAWLSQITKGITGTMEALQTGFGTIAGHLNVFSSATSGPSGPNMGEENGNITIAGFTPATLIDAPSITPPTTPSIIPPITLPITPPISPITPPISPITPPISPITPPMTPTLAPTVAHSASPEYMSIATSSVPSQIVLNEGATTGKAVKTPRTRTPRQAPQGPPRRSLRIIASAQKSRKGVSVTGSIAQEGGGTVVDTPVPKKEIVAGGLGGQIEMEPVIKVKSPILKPRAGTGIAKKKVTAEYLKGLLVANIKALVEMKGEMELKENQGITTTTPTVTLTETQIPASLGVHPLSTKSPNTARGSTPSPDKAKKAPRVKTPRRKTQGPHRRSARITESARKSAQDKPAAQEGGAKVDAKPKSPILRPRAGSGVTKKTGAGGSKGRISAGAKTKAKEEEKVKHPALMMPRAEARLRKGCIRGGPSLAARRQARRKLLV